MPNAILTSLSRTLEHEILMGRRFAPIDPEVVRALAEGGAQPSRQAETNITERLAGTAAPHLEQRLAGTAAPHLSLASCKLCSCRGEAAPVYGVGKRNSPAFMFVCEYPAAGADACGGLMAKADFELLENMLKAMGTSAEEVFITAAIKCRPPSKTAADEASPCAQWLAEQADEIKPKCIVAMGDYALRLLSGQAALSVRNEHGKLRKFKGIPFVPTFNPAYLNKFPAVKKDAWKDLKVALAQI